MNLYILNQTFLFSLWIPMANDLLKALKPLTHIIYIACQRVLPSVLPVPFATRMTFQTTWLLLSPLFKNTSMIFQCITLKPLVQQSLESLQKRHFLHILIRINCFFLLPEHVVHTYIYIPLTLDLSVCYPDRSWHREEGPWLIAPWIYTGSMVSGMCCWGGTC